MIQSTINLISFTEETALYMLLAKGNISSFDHMMNYAMHTNQDVGLIVKTFSRCLEDKAFSYLCLLAAQPNGIFNQALGLKVKQCEALEFSAVLALFDKDGYFLIPSDWIEYADAQMLEKIFNNYERYGHNELFPEIFSALYEQSNRCHAFELSQRIKTCIDADMYQELDFATPEDSQEELGFFGRLKYLAKNNMLNTVKKLGG